MSNQWSSILQGKPEEAKRPDPVPVGTYLATVGKHEFKESPKKGTLFVQYSLTLVMPKEDVDMEQLRAYGGMEKLNKRTIPIDMYMTPESMWRHREFLEQSLKIPFNGRSWQVVIPETQGKQVLVHITHQIDQNDPTNVFAKVDKTAAP